MVTVIPRRATERLFMRQAVSTEAGPAEEMCAPPAEVKEGGGLPTDTWRAE